jgi:uncharacterized protein VirK/YbjX
VPGISCGDGAYGHARSSLAKGATRANKAKENNDFGKSDRAMGSRHRFPVRRIGRVDTLRRLILAVAVSQPPSVAISRSRLLARVVGHFARCAMHLGAFRDWFSDPANIALSDEIALRPSLVTRAIHPYLNCDWPVERRLAAIGAHYGLLHGTLGFLRFARSEALVLADIAEGVGVRLEKLTKFEHEGELVMSLYWGERRVYCLAFTLGTIGSQIVAYAGALQGLDSDDALDTYRALTHRLQGMRPRDLLVTAFRQMCGALGVVRILAVSDRQRVCSRPYFTSSVQVFSSYDSAWIECRGSVCVDGFFELSPTVTLRLAHEIPVRKRAQYRRRYALLDACANQIDATVARAAGREPVCSAAPQVATADDSFRFPLWVNEGIAETRLALPLPVPSVVFPGLALQVDARAD